ncbi:sigma-E factor negative regulatory protein [Thalassolituus sp. UBA2590]|jgi:sigma-E factor negative regulatory protein RseA|uniref:sigma-E factor negative regulatory protein n=1 Tax=Thalassolituus sp. UBA2590 TaxID=1947663 RepID=UPI002647E43B|nr:sigma-E factor negative regulatory protein [Thalassolituus sp. UBA2590]MEE3160941.1 sigma-E factor negative regulatory protein [Pseudomonadota bacterium]
MKNRIRESLSALCDGECDELELRRVLNHVENDAEFREQWANFHLIGAAMRGESVDTVDLSKGIMQAIEGEPMDEVPGAGQASASTSAAAPDVETSDATQPKASVLPGWMVSGAVAASVTMAVLLGARVLSVPDVTVGSADMTLAKAEAVQSVPAVMPQSSVAAASVAADTQMSAAELAEAQERLKQYVLEHEDQAFGMETHQAVPYARVANFGQDSGIRERVRAEVSAGPAPE